MDKLDLDAPHEVIAAAGRYAGAAGAVVDHVAGTTGNLALSTRAESPLDHALVAKLEWIKTTFATALGASGSRAEATLSNATHTVNVLSTADTEGGRQVDRSAESI
ncbi:hypothetical protein OG563_06160 [Nocardia vinacea]|uniref:ESX-1 secretion-associated protein n=1 Tax=Nocardia vinacea TaxID=96468 RepID=A0ABZ1YX54_9NOCA|nr:hypothetical protein [Nocardia vinacea]